MHYLVTGHTGFKGSWLSMLLKEKGHLVSGISLDPPRQSLFEIAEVKKLLARDYRFDIRDKEKLNVAFQETQPDVVIHLAAQPLVRASYLDPRLTFETNVLGTLNVLEAASSVPSVLASLIVTTDKVYKNDSRIAPYVESDCLGGHDPYSASKAMADLLAQSWQVSSSNHPTVIARAGNVVGGGDFSQDRLIPDLLAGAQAGSAVKIRNPDSVRPWQHVLDCLAGYLEAVDWSIKTQSSDAFNFGPPVNQTRTVSQVITALQSHVSTEIRTAHEIELQPHEATQLSLDSSRANRILNWENKLNFDEAIKWVAEWHELKNPKAATESQIKSFLEL